jgi:hypothetical protein
LQSPFFSIQLRSFSVQSGGAWQSQLVPPCPLSGTPDGPDGR